VQSRGIACRFHAIASRYGLNPHTLRHPLPADLRVPAAPVRLRQGGGRRFFDQAVIPESERAKVLARKGLEGSKRGKIRPLKEGFTSLLAMTPVILEDGATAHFTLQDGGILRMVKKGGLWLLSNEGP